MTSRAAATRIARAFAFGGGDLVDDISARGADVWAATAFDAPPDTATTVPPPALSLPDPPDAGATREQRKAYRARLGEGTTAITNWWLAELVATRNVVRERVTLGWHDHFATSSRKVRDPRLMLAQNATLRRCALGGFDALAGAMARDPAMLVWLDAVKSTPTAPNENLAREFMELFCLGVDNGYTEADIRAAAVALTGWRLQPRTGLVTFDSKRHSPAAVTLFGTTKAFTPEEFVTAVLAQRQGDGYVVTRWWHRVVSADDPSPGALERTVLAYGKGRDIAGLLRAMATAPEQDGATGTLVPGPLHWFVWAARALRVTPDPAQLKSVAGALDRLGQVPFHPPSVGGWPTGRAWLSTSGLVTRMKVADTLARAADLSGLRAVSRTARVDAALRTLGLASVAPRTKAVLDTLTDDPAALMAAALVAPESLVI